MLAATRRSFQQQLLVVRSSSILTQSIEPCSGGVDRDGVCSRYFSSSDDGKDRNQPRGGQQRGGKKNDGWRRKNNYRSQNKNQENHNNRRGRRPKKQNFSDQFLEPAARGELKKHRSGIPKLAGRRPKGHGVRGADILPEKEQAEWEMNDLNSPSVEFTLEKQNKSKGSKTGTIAANSPLEELNENDFKQVMEFLETYQAIASMPDDEQYYWNEADYDDSGDAKKLAILEDLRSQATKDADGNLVVEVEDDIFDMFEASQDKETKKNEKEQPQRRQGGFGSIADDPSFQFVMESMGIDSGKLPPGPDYDQVKPLNVEGPEMSDFVEAMMRHPTKFSEIRHYNLHPESNREPVPDLPPSRINPSKEFVEANTRFVYVWGLPQLMVDGEPGDLSNPLHCLEIQKQVASLFAVSTENVSAASQTSAFIGFPSAVDQRVALEIGPRDAIIESPVTISKYEPKADNKKAAFAKESDSVVLLENLPLGTTTSILEKSLFPSGSEVGEVYGNLSADDIVMVSPTSALLKYESADVVEQAVNSSIVQQRLKEFGQHRIRYSKARRELVFTGKHGGPGGQDALRDLGSRLIVDGDMPTKKMYLSHARTLHLRNLDSSVTKQQISDFFQDFCSVPRDVEGSIEFVTCHKGLPTGRAYIGFDDLGEAEAAISAFAKAGGRISGGLLGENAIIVKAVKDSNKILRERRQRRSEEELLDSLHNWEQYVDPKDVEELVELGISKDALDEALRAIRYQNPTFAGLDQALRSETVDPNKEVGGMYREFVQEYISTLKECASTPENPGPIYESLFAPGEEIDTEIFEDEVDRQAELQQRRKSS